MNPRIEHLDFVLATVTAKLLSAYRDGHIDAVGEHIMANCLQSLYGAAFRHIVADQESGLDINDQARGLPTFAEMDEFEVRNSDIISELEQSIDSIGKSIEELNKDGNDGR